MKLKIIGVKKRKPLLFSTIGGTFSEIKEEPGFTNVGSWINKNIDDLDAYVYTDKDRPEYIGLIPNGEVLIIRTQPANIFFNQQGSLNQESKDGR